MSDLVIDPATGPVKWVEIRNLAKGDTFIGTGEDPIWIAQTDVQQTSMGEWAIRVQFASDGGIDTRMWSDKISMLRLRIRRA